MKRLAESDSLAGLISICPTTSEEHSPTRSNNHVYNREFQSMLEGLDEEGCIEESGHVPEKKRRLSVDQVKALEKNFEVENKLEPERKVKLAQELGLQPRQVAVWFQNRRARWKTKQLERDYGVLKTNYDALKLNYENLQHDKEALLKEIRELKGKLQEDKTESKLSVKEEVLLSDSDKKPTDHTKSPPLSPLAPCEPAKDFTYNTFDEGGNGLGPPLFPDFKDGSSDSDSSAILNEDLSPNRAISSSGVVLQNNPSSLVMSPTSFNHCSSPSSSSMNCFEFQKVYQPQQFVKMEHNFLSADEACNFFDDDQAPTLQWYCNDHQWN